MLQERERLKLRRALTAQIEISLLKILSQKVTYLFCDERGYRFKELISRVRQATKDVVKSEV